MNLDLVLIYFLSGCLTVTTSNCDYIFCSLESGKTISPVTKRVLYCHYFSVQGIIFWYSLISWIVIESGFCKFFERFITSWQSEGNFNHLKSYLK